jgi:hypothetical protein
MFLRAVLPEQHLSADSKDTVRLGIGVIATMAPWFWVCWSRRPKVFSTHRAAN